MSLCVRKRVLSIPCIWNELIHLNVSANSRWYSLLYGTLQFSTLCIMLQYRYLVMSWWTSIELFNHSRIWLLTRPQTRCHLTGSSFPSWESFVLTMRLKRSTALIMVRLYYIFLSFILCWTPHEYRLFFQDL